MKGEFERVLFSYLFLTLELTQEHLQVGKGNRQS